MLGLWHGISLARFASCFTDFVPCRTDSQWACCLGRRFFMIFNNFGFSHGQISKFWNGKKLLSSICTCCLYLAEVKKRWILIKFWTGMIYGKIYDYFPTPNYSWTNGIFLWIVSCKNYFCTWQNLSKFRKKPKNLPPKHTYWRLITHLSHCLTTGRAGVFPWATVTVVTDERL